MIQERRQKKSCVGEIRGLLFYANLALQNTILKCLLFLPHPQRFQVCYFLIADAWVPLTLQGISWDIYTWVRQNHGSLLSCSALYLWCLAQGLQYESSPKVPVKGMNQWAQVENKHLFENGCHKFMIPKWMLTENTGCLFMFIPKLFNLTSWRTTGVFS